MITIEFIFERHSLILTVGNVDLHQIFLLINLMYHYFQKPHTQWHVADVSVEPWRNNIAILDITDR